MQIIPTQALPFQTLAVQLAGQACIINLYQKTYGLFMDLYVSGILVVGGAICENRNRIVRNSYLGFIGDFIFGDLQGENDPIYTGLGTQYFLVYLEEADLPGGG